MELVGLNPRSSESVTPQRISGGQPGQRYIGIARALAVQPGFDFCVTPRFSALDVSSKRRSSKICYGFAHELGLSYLLATPRRRAGDHRDTSRR